MYIFQLTNLAGREGNEAYVELFLVSVNRHFGRVHLMEAKQLRKLDAIVAREQDECWNRSREENAKAFSSHQCVPTFVEESNHENGKPLLGKAMQDANEVI